MSPPPDQSIAISHKFSLWALSFRPLALVLAIALAALALRVMLPGSDPFEVYFEQYLRSTQNDDEERARNLTARIAQLGSHAADQIGAILESSESEPHKLEAAARLAGYVNQETLRPRLVELADPAQELAVRIAALESLARLGGEVSLHLLERALADPNAQVRIAALGTVGQASPPALVSTLEQRVAGANLEERFEAVAALGRMQSPLARRALWRLYQHAVPATLALAAKRALTRYAAPSEKDAAQLAVVASGYLPFAYRFASHRAKSRLERRLRALLMYRLEDQIEELAEDHPACGDEEECRAQRAYYRDLLRRKTQLELEVEGFLPMAERPAGDPLLLVRTSWLLRDEVRHLSLSLVRVVEGDPAIFPIRELGFETFRQGLSRVVTPALGEILRVSGRVRGPDLVVDLVVPVAGLAVVERYRFEGGVFVALPSGEF